MKKLLTFLAFLLLAGTCYAQVNGIFKNIYMRQATAADTTTHVQNGQIYFNPGTQDLRLYKDNAWGSLGSGGGITNGAATNEIPKSDGTNIVSSGIFSTSDGNIVLGSSALAGGARSISTDGSATNRSLQLISNGTHATASSVSILPGANFLSSAVFNASTNGTSAVQNNFIEYSIGTTGTAANGFGFGVDFSVQNNDGTPRQVLRQKVSWSNATTASRTSRVDFTVLNNASEVTPLTFLGSSILLTLPTSQSGIAATGLWNNGGVVSIGTSTNYILDRSTSSTASSTITLDLNSQIQRMFVGSASFATAKDIALSNSTNALVFDFHFEVTDVAATITMPVTFLMSDINFTAGVWTPPSTGLYEMGGSFDGTNWKVKILGPFN
jgi:hypothetical protein